MSKELPPRGRFFRKRQQYVCIYDLRRLSFPDADMELTKLIRDYWPDQMPVIIRVTVGYCGANAEDFTFSTDEIYLVTHVKRQTRVILKDRTGMLLSFPEDHDLKFHVLSAKEKPKDSEAKQLWKIIQENTMTGSKIQLVPDGETAIEFYAGPDHTYTMEMDWYEVETTYEERYLVGNSISAETLDSSSSVIPIWMPISVDVATGIKEGTSEEFKQLMRRVTTLCRDFDNENTQGHKEVMIFEEEKMDFEGDYDTIEPSNFYQYDKSKKQDRPEEKHSSIYPEYFEGKKRPPPPPPPQDATQLSTDSRCNQPLPNQPETIISEDIYEGFEDAPGTGVPNDEKSTEIQSSRKSLGAKERDCYEIVELNDTEEDDTAAYSKTKSIMSVKPKIIGPTSDIPTPQNGPSLTPGISLSNSTVQALRQQLKPIAKPPEKVVPKGPVSPVTDAPRVLQKPIPRSRPGSRGGTNSQTTEKDKPLTPCKPNAAPRSAVSKDKEKPGMTQTQSPQDITGHERKPVNKSGFLTRNASQEAEQAPALKKPETVNKDAVQKTDVGVLDEICQPIHKIPPQLAPKPDIKRQPSSVEATKEKIKNRAGTEESPYKTYSDLPKRAEHMSIPEVANCLKELNMSRHVERFQEESIDGQLLVCLDEKMLMEDFKFNHFEAKKLIMFAKGWRPIGPNEKLKT